MTEEEKPIREIPEVPKPVIKRPLLLLLTGLFGLVYFLITGTLFALSVFYSGRITQVLNSYIPEKPLSDTSLALILAGGAVLHFLSAAGILMMFRMKRTGYFVFSIPAILITFYQLYQDTVSPVNTAFYVVMIFIFGIFIKKLK